MRLKKQLRFTIVVMLVVAMFITGCAKKTDDNNDKAPDNKTDNKVDVVGSSDDKDKPTELEPMILEVYSQPANFQGEQPGWTAKILKDKFNVTLNIIAPQVAGGDRKSVV